MAFWTLALVVVSLWVPVVPSESNPTGTPFTVGNLVLLAVLVGLATWVVPATRRVRLVLAAILLGATLIAWALDGPIRQLLGPRYARAGQAAACRPAVGPERVART